MRHTLPKDIYTEEEARVAAVRATLEELRELALQSKLLALNTAIESVQAGEAGMLAEQAHHALNEAERVANAVDSLLQQINANVDFVKH